MRKGQSQRALGRLASLVIAGVVACAVVAAIAIAASNGSNASQAGLKDSASFGVVKLGSLPEFSMIAYSWGVSNSGSQVGGGGGGAGKANVQDLSFTKYTDANTVDLLKKVTTGDHYPTAVVTVTDPATSATLVYEMQDVLVTSDSLGGSVQSAGKPVSPTENVTLNFAKVTWTYTDAAGNSTSGSWNIAANTP
jgi:type VI secretion system secreted protein Hcp